MEWVLVFAIIGLSYANGANDTFKGVATLFGTGTTAYRPALNWATLTTLAGSVSAVWLGSSLVKQFSGNGLVPAAVIHNPSFVVAVVAGAACTVFLATRLGYPVSTTHGITGALVGAGISVAGVHAVNFWNLKTFFIPLLTTPLLAMVATALIYPFLSRTRRWLGIERQSCVCVGGSYYTALTDTSGQLYFADGGRAVQVVDESECQTRYTGALFGFSVHRLLDRLHFLSAGAVSFARGLNDTPKIMGLLVLLPVLPPKVGVIVVGGAMAIGAILNARRVAETMSHGITSMNHGQGLSANLVTALLVIGASRFGVPVSTTHVSCGGLFAIGIATGEARWRTIGQIAAAWVITLPVGVAIAWGVGSLLQATLGG